MNTKYLIIGGTGSLGRAVLRKLYEEKRAEVSVFSRNELNQVRLKEQYPGLNTVVGDVRDFERLKEVIFSHDVVFNFAALKHVDLAEANIEESVKTNISGTINVAKACIENNVEHCIFSSTDKGVLPINVYGMCKGISERYLLSQNQKQQITKFSVYRWGNVAASAGSAIPFFIRQLRDNREVTITDTRMSRFWITLDKAADFVLDTYVYNKGDKVLIPVMKAATVERVVQTLATLLDINKYKVRYIGLRSGEKIHECLHSDHDDCINSNTAQQYSDEELIELLEPIIKSYV